MQTRTQDQRTAGQQTEEMGALITPVIADKHTAVQQNTEAEHAIIRSVVKEKEMVRRNVIFLTVQHVRQRRSGADKQGTNGVQHWLPICVKEDVLGLAQNA